MASEARIFHGVQRVLHLLLRDRHASDYVRSVRGKLCAAFSFGPGSARGSRVGGRALSIANFSGVQVHFAALLTTFGRGAPKCCTRAACAPRKESCYG